jgi:hypothetical protein
MLDAYDLARLDGFSGSRDEFAAARYLEGGIDAARAAGFAGTEQEIQSVLAGKSASTTPYDMAVMYGFRGTAKDWLASLHGSDGLSAYQLALVKGYKGGEDEWLVSLKGQDGLDAYQLALTKGFDGSLDDFLDSLQGKNATPEQIYAAVTTFLTLNPPKDGADATPEMVAQAVDVWLSANPPAPGQKGDMPGHQWDGTRIRFEKPDGSWGEWVDLRGTATAGAGGGGGSLSIQKFYPSAAAFPGTGKTQVLYFAQDTNPWGVYIWTGSTYQQVGGGGGGGGITPAGNPGQIQINGGTALAALPGVGWDGSNLFLPPVRTALIGSIETESFITSLTRPTWGSYAQNNYGVGSVPSAMNATWEVVDGILSEYRSLYISTETQALAWKVNGVTYEVLHTGNFQSPINDELAPGESGADSAAWSIDKTNASLKRVRYDAVQSLTGAHKLQACQNIGIGNPNFDFLTYYQEL